MHFWSLSVEEQFYLIWPAILWILGIRKARWFLIAATLACVLYRHLHWIYYDRLWFCFRTEARADALCIGCLIALLVQSPHTAGFLREPLKYFRIPALAVILFCVFSFHWLPPLFEVLSISVLICDAALSPDSVFARCFSFKPLAWLGTISYSVYVWQQFFLQQRGPNPWHWLSIAIMSIVILLSYKLVEEPCTLFGHSLSSVHRGDKETRVKVLHGGVARQG